MTCKGNPTLDNFWKNFSKLLLNLDCESICDPAEGDMLLAQGTHLTDSLH